MRAVSDLILRFVAKLTVLGWFRSVEVDGLDRVPRSGPVLVVAPHFSGFADAALLASSLERMPRFLAMSKLWTVPGLKPLLAFAGAVPVYRPSDGSTQSNVRTFERCERVLRDGGVIAIFPEGRINDRLRLLPLKTGAARIALGARSSGARGIAIVPVGLVFEDRSRVRSRAVVRVGAPIRLDVEIVAFVLPGEPEGEANHAAVDRLTEEVRRRLQATTVDFDDAADALSFDFAAQVWLRSPEAPAAWEVPLGQAALLATRLGRAPAGERAALLAATEGYRSNLRLMGLDDRDVVPGNTEKRFRRRYERRAAKYLLAAPFAAIGAVANALPVTVVYAIGRREAARGTRGNAKLVAAFAAFPLAWLAAGLRFRARGHRHPWVRALAVGPLCGWATLYAKERFDRNRRDRIAWTRLSGSGPALEALRARRSEVVQAVGATLHAEAAGPAVDGASEGDRLVT